ncbi:MAG: hypothetical protein ABJB12_13175 [Pseudomonadota bacterium]
MGLADLLLPSKGRLSADDIALLARISALLPRNWRVGHVHPSRAEQRALPHFEAISTRKWNLQRRIGPRYEALLAGRMPGFAHEADAPFQSALASSRLLLVLGAGPDSARLLAETRVPGGSLRVYRGDFTDPLLRVDDYPTGVRPILDDLSSIHEVLTLIDAAGLPFHLGIVPSILEDRMLPFLRGLAQLVVSQHGVEHGYAKHSKLLLDAGDPFNQKGTVGGFDEFAGLPYAEVLGKLQGGRQSLSARLGQTPRSYIPPCNESNHNTGRALEVCGFDYILSEKPVRGCELPCIGSDFYDRSSAYDPKSTPNVASLHATWEADLRRAGDVNSLPKFLAGLVNQRSRRREEASRVADSIASTLARA